MFENTGKKISSILKALSGKGKITEKNVEDAVEEIKIALLDADVNLRVVRRFINSTLESAKGMKVIDSVNPAQQFTKIVLDKITELFESGGSTELKLKDKSQLSVIMMLGLQGNGKTTSAGKLALRLKKEGRRVLLAACDLQRPAAIDQLEIIGSNIDVPVFLDRDEKDVKNLALRSVSYAKKELFDTLIIDTSGRLSIDEALMNELYTLSSAVEADERLLVVDSMLGQIASDVAEGFDKRVSLSGVILTKFDSDTRGGAAMSITAQVHKPIKFVGIGEKMEDLELFYPDRCARSILGMGDIISLVEKAEEKISQDEAEKIANSVSSGNFSISDYLQQLDMMAKMGGMQKMLSMLPGLSGKLSAQQTDAVSKETAKERAIIYSMTKKERENYRIIGPPRRKRIAKGSGTSIADVDRFLRKFEKLKLSMQKVVKNKKLQGAMMKQFGLDANLEDNIMF